MRRLSRIGVVGIAFLLAGAAVAQDVSKKSDKTMTFAPKASAKNRPDTYGTNDTVYVRIGAAEFTGMQVGGVDAWNDVWYSTAGNLFRRYGQSVNAYFIAVPKLPAGAKLVYLELDDCGGTTDTVHLNLFSCSYTGDCGASPAWTIDATSGCGADSDDISSLGLVVDNFVGQILLRVITDANDGSNNFAGVIIGYKLQVSPAPAVATFLDVPTGSPQFQFIEALVDAGITAGCGGSNYCPNNPVTRGQMAVFLAKALGLHWTN